MPRKKLSTSFIFWLVLAKISILAVDQFLKYLSVSQQQDFFIWSKKLGFVYNINLDLAFNIHFPSYGIIIANIAYFGVLIWVLVAMWRSKARYMIWALSLFIVGALSNLIDRILHGFVIDYLYFAPNSYFNVADIAILIGLVLIAIWGWHRRFKGIWYKWRKKTKPAP